jgi:hypothetical protein
MEFFFCLLYIEGLRKTTKILSGLCVSKLNLGPLETKAAVLKATTWYIYIYIYKQTRIGYWWESQRERDR